MGFVSNPGFLAAAFLEASAAFILLVLYWLLAPDFTARFFRIWMAGWTIYVGAGALRIYSLWRGGFDDTRYISLLSSLAAALFFAAIVEYSREERRKKWLWPLAAISACAVISLSSLAELPGATKWAESSFECALYLLSGWMLWRSKLERRGFGWKLLAGALLLRALHGLDRPDWPAQTLDLLRVSFHSLLGVAMGIAMAVLVLEAGRARTEDLNERLRRLALITAEATHAPRMHEALEGVLRHVVEGFNADHGLVMLEDVSGDAPFLVWRASVGFAESFVKQNTKLSTKSSWVSKVLGKSTPFVAQAGGDDADLRRWMEEERLASIAIVSIPGKGRPLGMLGIGSKSHQTFESDEEHFLVNVANLLGLTLQNVALFETAANSRRQWLDTFDSIGDLIVVHGPDGRVLRANRALAWHLGVEPASLEGQSLRDLLTQGGQSWSKCPYCEGAAGKPEVVDPSFGGHFLVTNSDFHDSDGNRLGTIHVLKDFTERRQAENKFRMLFENVQEGIFISTPEGAFLDFNQVFMEIVGYESREDLMRAEIAPTFYVDPADRERLKRLLREHGEVNDFEFQFRRRDGEIRTAHESSFVTRDDSGKITAYQGFVLDVTDRKHAETELRRRNRELLALNAIAEVLGQSGPLEEVLTRALAKVREVLAVDTGALYLLDEPARTLKRMAAIGHRTEIGRDVRPIEISSSLLDQVRQARAAVFSGSALAAPEYLRELQQGEGIADVQVAVLWSKDRIIGALVVGSRLRREFSTAELNLLAALANQIAATIDKSVLLEETREAYESLRCAQEQLLQSEKMAAVGQLISGVAHELNNPLTAILGYSQLLKTEEQMHGRVADYLEKLYKQAQRTHHIVQNLLSFARQHKPERAQVDLNQILEDTLTLREYDMNLNNIRIHRQMAPRLPATGADFHQLQQVFLNILNNAVDAIGEKGGKGEIWVRTDSADGRVRVEITDSGPGVQNPHRVFDPFYTTKPVGKGTGLGLSICYGIIKEHGGEIQVKNSPPRGATFTISLPALHSQHAQGTDPTEKHPERIFGKVLIVDDEETVLQLEHEVLRTRGLTVKLARSAQEAVEVLRRDSVDAVITDGKISGDNHSAGLHRWIEQNRPELAGRLLFTLSSGTDGAATAALKKTGCPVIRKPFAIDELWIAVQKLLATEVPASIKR